MNNTIFRTPITKAEIEGEFEIATHGMTFETEQEIELRALLFRYFTAGALWAQALYNPAALDLPFSDEEGEH